MNLRNGHQSASITRQEMVGQRWGMMVGLDKGSRRLWVGLFETMLVALSMRRANFP
jgi:hypothetical protein